MGLLDSIKNAPVSAWNAVKGLAGDAKDTAGDVANVAKDTAGFAGDVFESTYDAARYLARHSPNLDQIKRVGRAGVRSIKTGEAQRVVAELPAYPKLEAGLLAEARKKAEGQTIAQPFIKNSPKAPGSKEPVNIVVAGSKQELIDALKKAGWRQAPGRTTENFLKMGLKTLLGTEEDTNGPVSAKYLDGNSEVMAFNKNDDFNVGRDHLRIFPAAPDPATGHQRWRIAATRDLSMNVGMPKLRFDGLKPELVGANFGHTSDRAIDGERDLILQSLLDAGVVSDWRAVKGEPLGQADKQPDGTYKLNGEWKTDGYVYDISLASTAKTGG